MAIDSRKKNAHQFYHSPRAWVAGLPAIANAHAALTRFCALNSLRRQSETMANTVNRFSSDRLTFANVHAALATF